MDQATIGPIDKWTNGPMETVIMCPWSRTSFLIVADDQTYEVCFVHCTAQTSKVVIFCSRRIYFHKILRIQIWFINIFPVIWWQQFAQELLVWFQNLSKPRKGGEEIIMVSLGKNGQCLLDTHWWGCVCSERFGSQSIRIPSLCMFLILKTGGKKRISVEYRFTGCSLKEQLSKN